MNRRPAGGLVVLAMTLGLCAGVASGNCAVDEDCDDFEVCTYDECTDGVCSNTPRLYGDVDGNGLANVFDIVCILQLTAGEPVEPGCDRVNANIAPCIPGETLNVFDIFAVLNMIAGWDPCCRVREEMVQIPTGPFAMGDHHDGISCALPVHTVRLAAFYMDVYEVTNQRYADALTGAYEMEFIYNPDLHGGVVYVSGWGVANCDTTASSPYSRITWNGRSFGAAPYKEDHPVVEVSWYGAVAYANWRSVQEGRTPSYNLSTWECDFDADGYRLPTEAEWEYAARGGQRHLYYRYPWGDAIDGSKANYWASGDPYETGPMPWTTPVGYYDGNQMPPGLDMANGYGLYDMAGNVYEWCHDWYDPSYYSSGPLDNPRGPATGTYRVLRGGSWYYFDMILRCAHLYSYDPHVRCLNLGFRLALDQE